MDNPALDMFATLTTDNLPSIEREFQQDKIDKKAKPARPPKEPKEPKQSNKVTAAQINALDKLSKSAQEKEDVAEKARLLHKIQLHCLHCSKKMSNVAAYQKLSAKNSLAELQTAHAEILHGENSSNCVENTYNAFHGINELMDQFLVPFYNTVAKPAPDRLMKPKIKKTAQACFDNIFKVQLAQIAIENSLFETGPVGQIIMGYATIFYLCTLPERSNANPGPNLTPEDQNRFKDL